MHSDSTQQLSAIIMYGQVLMSGRYSIHTGCEHILFGASEPSCLPTEFPIMPEAFKRIGYQTHMAGKW